MCHYVSGYRDILKDQATMLACINSLRMVMENMKRFWVIVVMIIVLVSFFMFSRYLVKRVEMGAEVEQQVDEIKQALVLLRRRL